MRATSKNLSPQRWLGAAVWAAGLLAPLPADADPLRTVWSCWLHEAQNLACVAAPAAAQAPKRPAGALGGLRQQVLVIPLHNVPFNDGFVAELAQSVLCGRQRSCEARYRPDSGQLVALAPADFADSDDPVLADARQ